MIERHGIADGPVDEQAPLQFRRGDQAGNGYGRGHGGAHVALADQHLRGGVKIGRGDEERNFRLLDALGHAIRQNEIHEPRTVDHDWPGQREIEQRQRAAVTAGEDSPGCGTGIAQHVQRMPADVGRRNARGIGRPHQSAHGRGGDHRGPHAQGIERFQDDDVRKPPCRAASQRKTDGRCRHDSPPSSDRA